MIRLGAVTGVGHARLIFERFGKFWGAFSVGDLFLLNFLTIVTEFIGVSLALGYFGVSKYLAVPIAAVALVAITSTGSFRSWERFMYLFVVANFLVVPLLVLAHPSVGEIASRTFSPGIKGGASSTAVLLIIAIVGTTVAPWQLFFQQSNIIDKRITPRWINYERADTVIGTFVVVIGAGALVAVTAFAFVGTPYFGHFSDAGTVATELGHVLGSAAGIFFAIVLLNASLIGAAAVTLVQPPMRSATCSTPSSSLNRGPLDAKLFYGSFALMVAAAAGIVLIPQAPLGLITTSVQALAGVLLPSATVFLLLLCNDREVLGPWRNPPWLNAMASVIVATFVELSLILMATTMFPKIDVARCSLSSRLLVVGRDGDLRSRRWRRGECRRGEADRGQAASQTWTMPPLALLERPEWSRGRKPRMLPLRGYLVVAMFLLIIKTVQLGAPRRCHLGEVRRDRLTGRWGVVEHQPGDVTGCRPRLRRPAMMVGSAAIVSERSPPASCMRMIAPGWAPASALCTIAWAPGRV